jgi:transposase
MVEADPRDARIAGLDAQVAARDAVIAELQVQLKAALARIVELEARLGQNSSNEDSSATSASTGAAARWRTTRRW